MNKLVIVGEEGQCCNCGRGCAPVFGPHHRVRRSFDVYLGRCCGGHKLSLDDARALVGIEDKNPTKETDMTKSDKDKRKQEIEEFVKNKKKAADSTATDVKPGKTPPTKIPADLNATTGKSKKQLRRENEAKRDDTPTDSVEVKKKADKELDEAVKPKKKEKDPSMISVSQIATELGLDAKRARAKLRAALERDELPDGLEVTEGRWPLVKRDSAQHKQLIAVLSSSGRKAAKPAVVEEDPDADEDDDDETDEDDDEEDEEEGDESE